MATNYPGSLDTGTEQPSPLSTTEMDDAGFEHDVVHTNHSGAIIALETKVGTGSSSAVANSVLAGTGAGTSAWTTGTLANDISGNAATATSATSATTATNLSGGSVAATTGSFTGDVDIANATPVLTLKDTNNTGTSNFQLKITDSADTNVARIYTGGGDNLRFEVAGSDVLFLDQNGSVGIGTTSPGYTLDVNGTMSVSGIVTLGDEIKGGSGSAADPVFTFVSDGDTGLYSHAANDLGVSAGGTQVARFASNGIRVANGSAATPAYTFINDSNTGFYITGNNGVIWWSGNNNSGGYLWNSGIRTDNGSASTPAYSFTGDTDTGIIRYTTNQLAIIGGGVGCLIAAAGTVNTAGLSTSTTSGYRYVMRNSTFGTLYHYTSSADVKENITNVTASDAATWIDALQPVTFNERWLQDGTESDEDRAFREADIQVGFIADDVLANSTTAKFAQVEDVDGTLKGVGWKWECVIAAAVAEIKSLRTRVADLEAA